MRPEQNNLDSGGLLPQDTYNRRGDRGNTFTDRRHVFLVWSGVWMPSFNGALKSHCANS